MCSEQTDMSAKKRKYLQNLWKVLPPWNHSLAEGEYPVLSAATAMGDVHPAPALPTATYVLFSILCILIWITSFAKNNGIEEQIKDGDGNPRIFFKQLPFYFKKALGFTEPQIFKNCLLLKTY